MFMIIFRYREDSELNNIIFFNFFSESLLIAFICCIKSFKQSFSYVNFFTLFLICKSNLKTEQISQSRIDLHCPKYFELKAWALK